MFEKRATYSLTRSGWSFACLDCALAKKWIGRGKSPEEAYDHFVSKCGAPAKHPTQWARERR